MNVEIRAENAAKPELQGSSFLRRLISELEPVDSTFDYGCGKLRYRQALETTTSTLCLVDSEVQLSRNQMICGGMTSVREFSANSNHLTVQNTSEFAVDAKTFERGFCINVLSVIPLFSVRRRVLSLIRQKLRPNGTCMFVVQYRNSDFSRMRRMPNSRSWRDGYLIDSLRGYSFYGLISPEKLKAQVLNAGFDILNLTLNQGSVYLLAQVSGNIARERIKSVDENNNFKFIF